MKIYYCLVLALFVSLASHAQAFLPTDPNGTTLKYEVNKGDTVIHQYYVLKGMERRPEGTWMEVEVKEKLKSKGFPIKILHKPTSLSMDVGGIVVDAIEMEEDDAEQIKVSSDGELLSIPLQYSEGKLPLEVSNITLKVSNLLSVGVLASWKEKEIVGRETLELPSGKYETFELQGRVRFLVRWAIFKKGFNLHYTFWIAPGVGVVQFERKMLGSRHVYRLVEKSYPKI